MKKQKTVKDANWYFSVEAKLRGCSIRSSKREREKEQGLP